MRCLAICVVLVTTFPAAAQTLDDKEKADGFEALFNGGDLSGWKVFESKEGTWTAADSTIVCNGKGGGWLGTEREYDNFELRLEYRLQPGGNSGIYLRAPDKGWISRVGMEIQILDDADPKYAKLDFYQYCGSIYHVVPPKRRATKPAGQWNALHITADGRQIIVGLNGKEIVNADLDWYLRDPAVAKEHPGLKRTTGRVGLQCHSDPVVFRNLRIKPLKSKEAK
jgi:hypothetical protein